jgi:hypothetical protein
LKAIYFLYQFEHGHFFQSVPMLMERSSKVLKNGVQLVLAAGERCRGRRKLGNSGRTSVRAVNVRVLLGQPLLFFFQQTVDFFGQTQESLRVFLSSRLLAQNPPMLGLFTLHPGKYLVGIFMP